MKKSIFLLFLVVVSVALLPAVNPITIHSPYADASTGGGCYISIPRCNSGPAACNGANGVYLSYVTDPCIAGFTEQSTYTCYAGPRKNGNLTVLPNQRVGESGSMNGLCRVCCK